MAGEVTAAPLPWCSLVTRPEQRHREPVDVHLILRRDGTTGPEVLLSRRAGNVHASGLWHLVFGHLDGPHEDVVDALIREAAEAHSRSIRSPAGGTP